MNVILQNGMVVGKKLTNCVNEAITVKKILNRNSIGTTVFAKAFGINKSTVSKVLHCKNERTNKDLMKAMSMIQTKRGMAFLKICNVQYGKTGKWIE